MGPRPISRGENPGEYDTVRYWMASMGPRPISRGEPGPGKPRYIQGYASMGPRPISRGERDGHSLQSPDASGFNGAAADQPRRA